MIPCPQAILPYSMDYKPLGAPTDIDKLFYSGAKGTQMDNLDHSRPAVLQALSRFEDVRDSVSAHGGIYRKDGAMVKHGYYWLCMGFSSNDPVHRKTMPAKAVGVGFSHTPDESLIKTIDVRPDGIPYLTDLPPAINLFSSGGVFFEAIPYVYFSHI